MRIELRARSKVIGCLSTIIVFMLVPVSAITKSGSRDSQLLTERSHVIRRVKVFFQDRQVESLRPSAPFRRPPRVSGKHAAIQVEGLPLER